MRTFIHYGPNGEIISVAQVELMPAELPHPFNVTDESHGVLELDSSDPLAAKAGRELHDEYVVDGKSKRLRKASEVAAEQPKTAATEQPKPAAAEPSQPVQPAAAEQTKREPTGEDRVRVSDRRG